MDDEELMPPPMPPVMRMAALSMTGNLVLAFGIIFVLLGIASFVTDLLGIKGSGEFLVGLALCAIGIAIYMISKGEAERMVPPPPPPQPPAAEEMDRRDESASYR